MKRKRGREKRESRSGKEEEKKSHLGTHKNRKPHFFIQATAVLTVLGRPSYDEKTRTMTADVRVVPMRSLPSHQGEGQPTAAVAAAVAATTTTAAAVAVPQPPPHSPPSSSSSPRSLSLSRVSLLIDQLPISDGYIGNQYGFANDCLSTMSPSCNVFAGTGFYRPGFVGEFDFFLSFFLSSRKRKRLTRMPSTINHTKRKQDGSEGRWGPETRRGTRRARGSSRRGPTRRRNSRGLQTPPRRHRRLRRLRLP